MNILLLSKDSEVITSVKEYSKNNGHQLTIVSETSRAKKELESHAYDSVLLDCSIRPSELIGLSTETSPALAETVVLLIGPLDHNQRKMLEGRLSAHYSIDKPLRGKVFIETMQRVNMRSNIVRKVGLLGSSTVMEETIQTIMQIGPTPINILITGESGSGKEVIARAIHAVSRRADKPFLAVNCAALAEGILESELFGHEKGAFTGAGVRRIGMFEKADNGTIFLDEIGEIPHSTQIRLLRVLEEHEIMRVGGTDIIQVDVRVIAATNRNLDELADKGNFRRDLYYRIKVLEINAPPLRNRPGDIPMLIDRIARQFTLGNDLMSRKFSDDAKEFLSHAYWSGNVRELRNFVESCLALTTVPVIKLNDIPENLLGEIDRQNTLPVRADKSTERAERELIFRTLLELKSDISEIKQFLFEQQFPRSYAETSRMVEVMPLNDRPEPTLDEIEKQAVIDALEHTNGNRRKAAELLGIGERTLYRKIKQYGIK